MCDFCPYPYLALSFSRSSGLADAYDNATSNFPLYHEQGFSCTNTGTILILRFFV